jgi:uncharacterized membrane-anchored protein
MRDRFWFMAVVALQALSLAGMIGYKPLILESGQTITLETAPRDPRDPMRGDFVRLNYLISNLDLGGQALIQGKVLSISGARARVEYGIESYFIPEGTGREVEQEIREAKGMEVVVDDKGNAVLKGPAKQ